MILKAEPLDPSFKWRGHKPERRTWSGIALLLAIAVGAGFYVGRLSTAAPVATEQRVTSEQQAASAGSVAQSQAAVQSEAATAPAGSIMTSTDTKPAAKDETKTNATASSTATPKTHSTTATEKRSSSPPVVLINPSTADKAADGHASRQPVSKTEVEAPAKANAKTETHNAVDDASPAAAPGKRQAKSQPPARSSASVAPARQESGAVRRDDAYVPRRDDAHASPRLPQAAYPDQRERYDSTERDNDRARLEQPYPDRRYAEDAPPPRATYEDRRDYLRPFQGSRDFREYRRFGGYDDDPYADRRRVLRPMYGGPNY